MPHFHESFADFSRWRSGKDATCQCRRLKSWPVPSLGQKEPLEEEMATYSSILAWKTPWTVSLGLQQGCKESDTTERMRHTHTHTAVNISVTILLRSWKLWENCCFPNVFGESLSFLRKSLLKRILKDEYEFYELKKQGGVFWSLQVYKEEKKSF